jgi:hypothetical protein
MSVLELNWRVHPNGGVASLTERARVEICRRVGRDLETAAPVARCLGVGWAAAHQALIDHGGRLLDMAPAGLVRWCGHGSTSALPAGPIKSRSRRSLSGLRTTPGYQNRHGLKRADSIP